MKQTSRRNRSRKLLGIAIASVTITATATSATSGYAGSQKCVACHERHGTSWSETLHFRFMRPLEGDETIAAAGVFRDPAPVAQSEVAFALGHMHKLTLLTGTDGNLSLLGHQFDFLKRTWEPFDKTLWNHQCSGSGESPEQPEDIDWYARCAGCHTTGYDSEARTFVEPSIGCESCHGPGAKHSETESRADIVNPAALPEALGVHVCAQCHARGHEKNGTKPYPVGYTPGADLEKFFVFDKPVPGKTTGLFWENGAARQHHAQFNEVRQSKHFQNGVLCFDCHKIHRFRNTTKPSPKTRLMAKTERYMLRKRSHFVCLSCHEPGDLGFQSFVPNEDGVLIDEHTRHPAVVKMSRLPGAKKTAKVVALRCAECHMPSMSPEGAGYDIHSHRFLPDSPDNVGGAGVPNGCLNCHTTENKRWVRKQLKAWTQPRSD